MRLVLRDTTLGVLPRDPDLRSSHFERVTFPDGMDFTGRDLRDSTFYECVVRGAILPGHEIDGIAATDYLWSYKTDWTGAVIPSNISVAHHQWVPEIVRQANLTTEKPFADYEGREKEYTPERALAEAQKVHSPEKVKELVTQIFAPYPRLLPYISRVANGAANPTADVPATAEVTVQTTDPLFPDGPYAKITFQRRDFPSNDRFEIAEWMAFTFSEQMKETVYVYVQRLHPDIQVQVTTKTPQRWDWWGKWV